MKKRWIAGLFLAVVTMWFACWGIMIQFPVNHGTYGDMFGAVNALFSGLAFAGLICTLIVQMQELKAQREELAATRSELAGQKEIMKKQSSQIDVQNFENGFYQLLKLHYECIASIEVSAGSGNPRTGVDALGFLYQHILSTTKAKMGEVKTTKTFSSSAVRSIANLNVESFLESRRYPYSGYLTSLTSIFSFIDKSNIEDKHKYNKLVLNRMTKMELRGFLILVGFFEDQRLIDIASQHGGIQEIEPDVIVTSYREYLSSVVAA